MPRDAVVGRARAAELFLILVASCGSGNRCVRFLCPQDGCRASQTAELCLLFAQQRHPAERAGGAGTQPVLCSLSRAPQHRGGAIHGASFPTWLFSWAPFSNSHEVPSVVEQSRSAGLSHCGDGTSSGAGQPLPSPLHAWVSSTEGENRAPLMRLREE